MNPTTIPSGSTTAYAICPSDSRLPAAEVPSYLAESDHDPASQVCSTAQPSGLAGQFAQPVDRYVPTQSWAVLLTAILLLGSLRWLISPGDPSQSYRVLENRFQVDINSASVGELQALPSLGPKYAQQVAEYRLQHGPFQSVDELQNVPGIGPVRLQNLRPLLRVGSAGDAVPATPKPVTDQAR